MAQFDVHGLDELMKELDGLGNFDEVAPAMLEEAAPILEKEVVRLATPFWDSGDMVKSIKRTNTIQGRWGGFYICVRPTGKDQKGTRNMDKMAWLEFGVKGKAATPIITKAVLNTEQKILDTMQEVFNREVGAT